MNIQKIINSNIYTYQTYEKMKSLSGVGMILGGILTVLGLILYLHTGIGIAGAISVSASGFTLFYLSAELKIRAIREVKDFEAFYNGKWDEIQHHSIQELIAKSRFKKLDKKQNLTLLHLHVMNKALWHPYHDEELRPLIFSKSNLNEQNAFGETPLHLAIKMGMKTWIDVLSTPENIELQNYQNQTPLMMAIEKKAIEIAIILIQKGASIDYGYRFEQNLLHIAIERKLDPIIAYLIGRGIDLNKEDSFGKSPLSLAVNTERSELIKLLAIGGATIKHEHIVEALRKKQWEIASYLFQSKYSGKYDIAFENLITLLQGKLQYPLFIEVDLKYSELKKSLLID